MGNGQVTTKQQEVFMTSSNWAVISVECGIHVLEIWIAIEVDRPSKLIRYRP